MQLQSRESQNALFEKTRIAELTAQLNDFPDLIDTIVQTTNDGKKIIQWWPILFPYLDRVRELQGQVRRMPRNQIKSLVKRLRDIDQIVYCWQEHGGSDLQYPPYVHTDSQTTLKKYSRERTFTLPSGDKAVFSWHCDVDSSNYQLYLLPNYAERRIVIGYYGTHLPTVKFKS